MMNRRVLIYDGEDIIEDSMRDVEWHEIRAARNQALKDSDWRAGKDVVLSNEWKEFRDLLRTLPQRFADSGEACDNWPVMPDE